MSRLRATMPTEALVPIVVGLSVSLLHVALRMTAAFPVGVFADDGIYVSLGRALAEGQGFHSIYAPGSPLHVKYPPGLPWLFSLVWGVAPDLERFKAWWEVISPVFTGLSAALIYVLGKRVMGLPSGIVLVLGVGPFLTDSALHYFNLPLSEALYLLLWVTFVLALGRAVDRRPDGSADKPAATASKFFFAAALIVAALALLVRSQAVALVAGGGLVLAYRRSPVTGGLFSVGAFLPGGLWMLVRSRATESVPPLSQPDELGYMAWITAGGIKSAVAAIPGSQLFNAKAYVWILAENAAPWPWVGVMVITALTVLTLIGAIRRIREEPHVVVPTALALGLLLVWPWPQDRLLLSALPFAGLLAGVGLIYVAGKAGTWSVALVVLTALVLPRQFQIRQYAYDDYDPSAHRRVAYPSFFLATNARYLVSAATWINQNATRADRVMTPLHGGVFLYTGRQTITASPAQPTSGPTVFDVRGAYLASRILEDGVTLVALDHPRSPLAYDLQAISQSCRSVVEAVGRREEPFPVTFYRIHTPPGSEACLSSLAAQIPSIWR